MILRDPVHGLISFDSEEEDRIVPLLLDTQEVQRMRRIRCLGPASLAFPGAEHSRFAHAVGAAYVMKRYLDRVRRLSDDITKSDRIDADHARVALAAALLHDLGHGPLSHSFEAAIGTQGGGFEHEGWTSRLLLDPDTEVHTVLRRFGEDVPQRVERLIHGESPIPHLARAVSGTFDVDRCDYLMRDSHMTGVRYGLLDLDWLLRALRLYQSPDAAAATLAVDGEKGLTAVEGFFLGRLYMYRQVYLHKAVRAADAVIRALFVRLAELGPSADTPAGLSVLLRGEQPTLGQFLALDDPAFEHALARYAVGSDPLLRDLALRLRNRKLFKTLRLRRDVPVELARERVAAAMHECGVGPDYLATIDRVEVDAYYEDDTMMVLSGERVIRLLDASPVLHGLSQETFVHYRAVFPPEVRDTMCSALADLV